MNKYTSIFLQKLDGLPEFLDINDLVTLGLYAHKNGAYRARKNGTSPDYIKMTRKILYPKEAVRVFILERFHYGSTPMEYKTTHESNK